MSGIRSTSGVPPAVAGASQTPSSGPQQVAPVNPTQPAGQQPGLPPSNPPPNAGDAPEVTLINAVVTAKTAPDNVILHTDLGNFRVTSESPLMVGSRVAFELNKSEDIFLARLVSIDGKTYSPPLALKLLQIVDKPTNPTEGYVRAGQLHPLELKSGLQNLAATLGSSGAAAGEKLPQLPVPVSKSDTANLAAQNISRGLEKLAAYTRSGLQSPELTSAQSAQNFQAAASTAPSALREATVQLLRHHLIEARFQPLPNDRPSPQAPLPAAFTRAEKTSLILQPAPPGTVSSSSRPDVYSGTVVAVSKPSEATGLRQVQVNSAAGTFSYKTAGPPPPGTPVQFAQADKIAAFPLPYTDIQQPGPRPPLVRLMGDWQNLRLALNVVAHQDPIAAQSVISSILPQAGGQLTNNLLFFLTALQIGNVGKWLGQDFQNALRDAGRPQLLQALEDDFASLQRLQSDPGGQDWKSLNLPFFDGSNLRQIRLFHRPYREEGQGEDEADGSRFVIELSLSKTGPLQLDGFFTPRRFDLVLRSETEIPAYVKSDIIDLFTESMEISGFSGQLVFTAVTPFPVDPLTEWETRSPVPAADDKSDADTDSRI